MTSRRCDTDASLCVGGLRSGSGEVLALAWDIRTGLEVVVLGETVGAKMQVMDAALDCGLVTSTLIADSSFCLAAGADARGVSLCPVTSLHVKTCGCEDHPGRKDHGASAKESGIAGRGECCREETQAGKDEKTADRNHPASKFQSHWHSFVAETSGGGVLASADLSRRPVEGPARS